MSKIKLIGQWRTELENILMTYHKNEDRRTIIGRNRDASKFVLVGNLSGKGMVFYKAFDFFSMFQQGCCSRITYRWNWWCLVMLWPTLLSICVISDKQGVLDRVQCNLLAKDKVKMVLIEQEETKNSKGCRWNSRYKIMWLWKKWEGKLVCTFLLRAWDTDHGCHHKMLWARLVILCCQSCKTIYHLFYMIYRLKGVLVHEVLAIAVSGKN